MISKEQTEDFVKALTLAWKRLGLYPPNHPARAGAMDAPIQLLRSLLVTEEQVGLAAAEDALLLHEEKLESLPAAELARALYEHNIGVIRFGPAVNTGTLERFSSLLKSTDRQEASGLIEHFGPGRLSEVGIEVELVDYSGLVAQLEEDEDDTSSVSLLERLLSLQLSGHGFTESDGDLSDFESFAIQLRNHLAILSDNSALLGSLETDFAEQVVEVLEAHLTDGVAAGFHVVDLEHLRLLLVELPPALRYDVLSQLLTRLLDLDNPEAAIALQSASSSTDLLLAVRRLRREGVPFSSKLQRMAGQLVGDVRGRSAAREFDFDLAGYGYKLRPELPTIAPATLDDPASLILQPLDPDTEALVAARSSGSLEQLFDTLEPDQQRQGVLTSLLELVDRDAQGERLPPEQLEAILRSLARTFHELIVTGHANAALAVVDFLRVHYGEELRANSPMVAAALSQFGGMRVTESIVEAVSLASTTDDYLPLRDLVKAAVDDVAPKLVAQLSDCEDRRTRRRLFDFLVPLKPQVIGEIRSLLSRREWFHVRNGVSLLDAMEDTASVAAVRALALNKHAPVRDAAARFLLRLDRLIPVQIIERWLEDEDPQFVRRTIQLVGRYKQWNAVEPLMALVDGADTFRRQRTERAAAILALAQIGDADALNRLATQFESTLRLQHSDEKRLFYETLTHYKPEDRQPIAERGQRSRDAAIREICDQLLASEGTSP